MLETFDFSMFKPVKTKNYYQFDVICNLVTNLNKEKK